VATLPPAKKIQAIIQAIETLKGLHALDMAHLDPKLENWLVVKFGIKLTDFGMAMIRFTLSDYPEVGGTKELMSPEVQGLLGPHCEITLSADYWSVICIIFYAFAESKLAAIALVEEYCLQRLDVLEVEAVRNLLNVDGLGETATGMLAELISKFLKLEPELRPGLSEIQKALEKISLVVGCICIFVFSVCMLYYCLHVPRSRGRAVSGQSSFLVSQHVYVLSFSLVI
jgi:serine/threonine protein kinase